MMTNVCHLARVEKKDFFLSNRVSAKLIYLK